MVNNVSLIQTISKNEYSYYIKKKICFFYNRFLKYMETVFILILMKFIHEKFIYNIFNMFSCYIRKFNISMNKLEKIIFFFCFLFRIKITSRNCFGIWLLNLKLTRRIHIERIFSNNKPHEFIFKSNEEQLQTFES